MEFLIKSASQNNSTNLFCYNFETQKWIPVKCEEKLPYDIGNYVGTEGSFSIFTCHDSYLLRSENFPSSEEMEREREWRNRFTHSLEKVDQYAEIREENKYIRVQKIHNKDDVCLEGNVVMLLDVDSKRIESIVGYFHRDSNCLFSSGTYCEKITQEYIDEKIKSIEKITAREEKYNKESQDIENSLSFYRIYSPQYGWIDLPNTLEWYSTMKKSPEQVDIERVIDYAVRKNNISKEKIDELRKPKTTSELLFLGFTSYLQEYDVTFHSYETIVENYSFVFDDRWKCDFFFDIVVHDASYAYLKTSYNHDCPVDHLEKREDGIFVCTEYTYISPLFRTIKGDYRCLETDGKRVTFKMGMFNSKQFRR